MTAARKPVTVALRAGVLALLLVGSGLPLQAVGVTTGSTKFITTFPVYYGGGRALVASDAQSLAKFDLLDFDRFRYGQIAPNTWSAIKAINPNVEIYLYELGAYDSNFHDGTPQEFINDIDRYGVPGQPDASRGHSMGSLNINHPELFLKDSGGNRLYSTDFSFPNNNRAPGEFVYLMDFGTAAYQSYWLEATKTDVVNQPWVADGVFADECNTLDDGENSSSTDPAHPNPGVLPVKYSDKAAWSGAMNSFATAITAGLHAGTPTPQKLWCNRGQTRFLEGSAAWQALDVGANPPDAVMEEGAFAVLWGPWAVQFMLEGAESDPDPLQHQWKSQVDTLGTMRNSKVAVLSHTQLAEPGQGLDTCGMDNYNKTVCYWQTLWYSLGSFLISKNNVQRNSYFMFHGGDSDYNKIIWYDEYDKVDLGKALEFYGWQTFNA
jgi:hypothetical protein